MLQHGQKKNGFTIIEITVTLAIMAIVLAVAGTVYFFGIRMYTQTETKNSAKFIGDTVYEYMRSRLMTAEGIDIGGTKFDHEFTINDNRLYWAEDKTNISKDTADVFGKSWYNNYLVSYKIESVQNSDYTFKLTVNVKRNSGNEVAYTTSSTIKAVNIEKNNQNKTGNQTIVFTSDGVENPVITYQVGSTVKSSDEDTLITYMNSAYAALVAYSNSNPKNTALLPTNWSTNVGGTNISNDNIRKYVHDYDYGVLNQSNTFPQLIFSSAEITATDQKITSVKKLSVYMNSTQYIQPYIYASNPSSDSQQKVIANDGSVFLYARTDGNATSGQYTALVYDKDENAWYYRFDGATAMQDKPWTNTADQYASQKNYFQGIKEIIHDTSKWVKVGN